MISDDAREERRESCCKCFSKSLILVSFVGQFSSIWSKVSFPRFTSSSKTEITCADDGVVVSKLGNNERPNFQSQLQALNLKKVVPLRSSGWKRGDIVVFQPHFWMSLSAHRAKCDRVLPWLEMRFPDSSEVSESINDYESIKRKFLL